MKVKTSDLIGLALDWAASAANRDSDIYLYSTSWEEGGPIIERERITVEFLRWDNVDGALPVWLATHIKGHSICRAEAFSPLIAAMRCFVASRLGDEVDVPEEL